MGHKLKMLLLYLADFCIFECNVHCYETVGIKRSRLKSYQRKSWISHGRSHTNEAENSEAISGWICRTNNCIKTL